MESPARMNPRHHGDPAPSRSRAAIAVGLFGLALALLLLTWHWPSLAELWVALDPVSAAGRCVDDEARTVLFCDFFQHYYPEGKAVFALAKPIPGFFYPAPFAIAMGGLALLPYPVALAAWVGLLVAATAGLYLLPQLDLFARSKSASLLYGLLFATSLAVLHNFVWGQVSALTSLLVLGALVLHARGHRSGAAVALAIATSIKFYPAFFALYFVLRRDTGAVVVFGVSCALLLFALPTAVLGVDGTLGFYQTLASSLDELSRLVESSRYSNYIANAVSLLLVGSVEPDSALVLGLKVVGYALATLNAVLLYRLIAGRVEHEAYWAAALGMSAIPLVVATSWIHYFITLPFLQAFLFFTVLRGSLAPWSRFGLCAVFLLPSILFSNVFFFDRFAVPDTYYGGGFQFWSNALLLPVLYLQALRCLRGAQKPANPD